MMKMKKQRNLVLMQLGTMKKKKEILEREERKERN